MQDLEADRGSSRGDGESADDEGAPPGGTSAEERSEDRPGGRALPPWVPTLALIGVVVLGVVARFVTRSDLWLDEAQTVNIASLGLGDLLETLRQDGHPPLFYVLLHYWMQIAGEGDLAVRALSGIIAVASLPLAWIAGGRLAGRSGARWALVLVALSPYWVRYASEARMYALVMLLVLGGYLVMGDALRRPTPARLAGIAVLSGLLLLSHYWAFWLLASVGIVLLWRWWWEPSERAITGRVIAAVAAGSVLFLPWLPSFLHQMRYTGTPWAGPVRPIAIADLTLRDLGGGPALNESFLYAVGVVVLWLLALLVTRAKGTELTLDLRTSPAVRTETVVIGLTAAIGCVTAYVASATFQPRYAAVFVPLVLLVAAAGLARMPEISRVLLGGMMAVLSVVGIVWHLYYERTQAGVVAAAISQEAQAGDVVIYCPDQLGPAYSRATPEGLVERAYPTLESPEIVDWVDYAERNAQADPEAIAAEVHTLAAGQNIFMVWMTGYETFGTQCQELLNELMARRPGTLLVAQNGARYYEPANLTGFKP